MTKANYEGACALPFHINPLIKLLDTMSYFGHFYKLIAKHFKLGEIGCCLVLRSVEDEKRFSTLKFLAREIN